MDTTYLIQLVIKFKINIPSFPAVGNDFFPGGPGVDLVLELREVSGGGFWDPKIDQFWPNLQF